MVRPVLAGISLAALLTLAGGAFAQGAPTLPTMPKPPSFDDPVPSEGKGRKATRRSGKAAGSASSAGSTTSFERPNKFVPAEFDNERRGSSGGGAAPVMSGSGRPGMGMRF